jgi:hypothetical protein
VQHASKTSGELRKAAGRERRAVPGELSGRRGVATLVRSFPVAVAFPFIAASLRRSVEVCNNIADNLSSAAITIDNSTLSGNYAPVHGGGIYNNNGGLGSATLTIRDTILGASGENIFNSGGTVTSLGYNVSNDGGGGFLTATGDQINTDPMLGPLQDNGGPAFTHALLSGSPAIDAGDPSFDPYSFSPPLLEDQRALVFRVW